MLIGAELYNLWAYSWQIAVKQNWKGVGFGTHSHSKGVFSRHITCVVLALMWSEVIVAQQCILTMTPNRADCLPRQENTNIQTENRRGPAHKVFLADTEAWRTSEYYLMFWNLLKGLTGGWKNCIIKNWLRCCIRLLPCNWVTNSTEEGPSWEANRTLSYSNISSPVMKPEGPIPCSQQPATGPYPKPAKSIVQPPPPFP